MQGVTDPGDLLSELPLEALKRKAEQGDASALFDFAGALMLGYGVDADAAAAVRRLIEAAEAGEARAWRVLGVLRGLGAPEDPRTLAIWKVGAELGDTLAAKLLEAVGGAGEDVPRAVVERDLRRIDWTTSEPAAGLSGAESICERPRIYLAANFLQPLECLYLRLWADERLRPATIMNNARQEVLMSDFRLADDCGAPPWRQDPVIGRITRRLAALTGNDIAYGERLTLVRYKTGGFYRPHFDTPEEPAGAADGVGSSYERSGRRTVSLIAYLNDGYDGGETAFVRPRLKIAGAEGDVIFFHNLTEDGELDRETLHSGMPVADGEKWVCLQWYRERVVYPAFLGRSGSQEAQVAELYS